MIGCIQFTRLPIPRMYIAVTLLFYTYTYDIAHTEM